MASVRQIKKTGKWEVTLKHKLLPKRAYFTFDDEDAAREYGARCDEWLKAGVVPQGLISDETKGSDRLGPLIMTWINTGRPSPSDVELLNWMFADVSSVKLSEFTYSWAEGWIQRLKLQRNLAPGTIRKYVGALARCIDHHMRRDASMLTGNPLRSLPDGYSVYTEKDALDVAKLDGKVKHDVVREHRLAPAAHDRVMGALSGVKRDDRERALTRQDFAALRIMLLLILDTGCRLREAYTLTWGQVDFKRRVIRVRSTKRRRGQVEKIREVPIKPSLYAQLESYRPDVVGEDRLMFPFWDGEKESLVRTSNKLSARFATVFRYAECEELTEHDMRHEATCRWYELRGGDGNWLYRHEEVCKIMGWSPSSPMGQRYASFRGEDLAARMWATTSA